MSIKRLKDIPQFTSDGSYQIDLPATSLAKWVEDMENDCHLNLCPDFQRGHVWTREQQVKWLEYFFMGGKSGKILYFNCPSWRISVKQGDYDEFVCVDGLQRITAIQLFIRNELPIFGTYFSEFEDPIFFHRWMVKINVNDLKTKKEVLQWYIEMNSGGTPHTEEEIKRVMQLMEKC